MNKIGDTNLYIGNSSDVFNLPSIIQEGITEIVNVAKDLNDPWCDNINFYKIGLIDGPGNDQKAFDVAGQLISYLLKNDRKVLLHCHEGRSRSAAVGILVLQLVYGFSFEESKHLIFESRPLCKAMNPNLLEFCK